MRKDDHLLRELAEAELGAAAQLMARGMHDNPINLRVFGEHDTERRGRVLARFFGPVLHGLHRRGTIVGVFRNGTMVGVCGMAPPGHCQPTALEKLTVLPALGFGNATSTPRLLCWTSEWSRRDPAEPHWHLGPVAVDSILQGKGIGSAMLADFCGRMDRGAAGSYLETDKPENVRFYERFGFIVKAQADVLGVPNWFMQRN